VFWHGAVCVCKGWAAGAGISAGCEREASGLTLCCRTAVCWCCRDAGPALLSAGEGGGMRDAEAFSMCRGERGETEGVTLCPGERKM